MNPSRAAITQIEQVERELSFDDRDKILRSIQDDALSSYTFKTGYLNEEWSDEEIAAIKTQNELEKAIKELEDLTIVLRRVESNLKDSKAPKFFGKEKFEQEQAQLRSQLENYREQVVLLKRKIEEYREITSKNIEVLKLVEEKREKTQAQYSIDEKYFKDSILNLENRLYAKVLPSIPEGLLSSDDSVQKINFVKECIKDGVIEVYKQFRWKRANLFMYFICRTMPYIDNDESIILNGSQHKLHNLCANLLWQFVNNCGGIFTEDIFFWEIKAMAYLHQLEYDKELAELTEKSIRLSKHDPMTFSDFLISTVQKSSNLKNVLNTISKSIQAGKQLAIRQNNEKALNHYQKLASTISQVNAIKFYSHFGLYKAEQS